MELKVGKINEQNLLLSQQKCVVIEEELRRLHSGGKGVSPVDQGSMVAQAMAKASEVDTIPGHGGGTRKSQPQIDTSMVSLYGLPSEDIFQ